MTTTDLAAYLESRLSDYLADLTTLTALDSGSFDKDDVNHVVDWLESRLTWLGFTVERHPQPINGDNLRADRKSVV